MRPYNSLVIDRRFPESLALARVNSKYFEAARLQIPNPELLVNIVSKRVRQLTQGHRPLTMIDPKMDYADIALKEISELTTKVESVREFEDPVALKKGLKEKFERTEINLEELNSLGLIEEGLVTISSLSDDAVGDAASEAASGD